MDFEQFCTKTKEQLLKSGSFTPELIVTTEDNKTIVAILADLPGEHEDKVRLFLGIGNKMAADEDMGKIKKVYFAAEGWMLQLKKGEKQTTDYIRDEPNRIEVLLCTETYAENKKGVVKSYKMKRDKEDKLISVDILESEDKVVDFESPLINAFLFAYNRTKEKALTTAN